MPAHSFFENVSQWDCAFILNAGPYLHLPVNKDTIHALVAYLVSEIDSDPTAEVRKPTDVRA